LVDDGARVAAAFNLTAEDLAPDLPLEVVSTGLRYLIVPVRPGALARARILHDITELVQSTGAQFARPARRNGSRSTALEQRRHHRRCRDGSAAARSAPTGYAMGWPVVAKRSPCIRANYTGRPSTLRVQPEGNANHVETVKVGGDVAFVGHGVIEALPSI